LLGHYAASFAILFAGSGEQRRRWLPTLASGRTVGAFAWSDDGAGRPGGGSVLHGARLHGSHANVPGAARAGLIVVRTADGRLAVVEAAAPGMRIRPGNSVDRTRRVAEIEFADAAAEPLADGASGHGDRVRDALLVLLAADAFGGGSRCLEMAVEYARTRVQFGVPIGQFQAVKHQLANMGVEIEPARGLYWFAAHAFDHVREQAARAAALAKAHLTDIYLQLARQTIELHGGIGFTWDADVQIFFKRAMFDYAWLGTPVVQRARAATLAGW
jgi:alkylation response protein AidB-like acyl-CoA dehydrogenase